MELRLDIALPDIVVPVGYQIESPTAEVNSA